MKLTQHSIRQRIEHITKAGIDRTLREVYIIDIKDIEGPNWTKDEGLNLLAYEIFNGIQQTELGNAKAEDYNLGKAITDAINSDADITVISLGPLGPGK
ncbi:hypothetical protein LCGC14_2414940 [marine sediment metagenome]|uniref:Uncharacterized protein n=1 Tax=marine sediment metagenome TaxID=412755 RepID=A0A0F9E3J4_9ZZZZ